MKNIKLFSTEQEQLDAVLEPTYVAYNEETGLVTCVKPKSGGGDVDYTSMYTTFEALENGTFSIFYSEGSGFEYVNYSLDGGQTWNDLQPNEQTPLIKTGERVNVKIKQGKVYLGSYALFVVQSTCKYNLYGNSLSLIYGDEFIGKDSLEIYTEGEYGEYVNEGMYYSYNSLGFAFAGIDIETGEPKDSLIVDASNFILPKNTAIFSYYCMFCNNTYMTKAPVMDFETITYLSCGMMFAGCTSLNDVPDMKVKRIISQGCNAMFKGCSSLVNPPMINVTEFIDGFQCEEMFADCTSLIKTPVLSISTLTPNCYINMFSGCTNLSEITMLATDISAEGCLEGWVQGVSSTGTFYKHPDIGSLPTGIDGIPEGWTIENYQG